MKYPDAKRSIRDLLSEFGSTYLNLTADYAEKPMPAILVYRSGGEKTDPFRMDRIVVEVYAQGDTLADQVAEQIEEFLTSTPHFTPRGLIDKVETEVVPVNVPQPEGFPSMATATYRAYTRGT